ncbi:MAG: hypothetical protein IPN36_00940 [Bacteroidetes bacterium]|nr:hypothetical protein [Bacteroidota bacterium]
MRIWSLLVLTFFLSCSGRVEKNPENSNPTNTSDVSSVKQGAGSGQMLSHQSCFADNQLSYSVYYPTSFSEHANFPVLILFDPHADGDLPLNLYKSLADKYGFILLSSSDSKNGNSAERTAAILQGMMAQVSHLQKADTSLIFCGGFSGGARVAAMLGLAPSGIKAIVVCGAGIPQGTWQGIPPHLIVAIAGNRDMNLSETIRFQVQDQRLQSRYQLIRFDGGHSWPPQKQMEQAFIAFKSIAQRDRMEDADLPWVNKALDQLRAYVAEEENPIIKAESYRSLLKNFQGVVDVSKDENEYDGLVKSKVYISAQNREIALFQEEEKIKSAYFQAFGSRDTSWWQKEMNRFLDTTSFSNDIAKISMIRRVQGALSLTIYMSLTRAISALENSQQMYFSALYRYTDPDNTEAWYLSSVVAANMGNLADAKYFLSTAFKKGFKDVDRCKKEASFASIVSDYGFQSIINQTPL